IQQRGDFALRNPGVERDLGITPDQDDQLGKAIEDAFGPYYKAMGPDLPRLPFLDDSKPLDERLKLIDERREAEHKARLVNGSAVLAYEAACEHILSRSQMENFKRLQGRMFSSDDAPYGTLDAA